MSKKAKILFSLLLVIGYGLVQVFNSIESSPKKSEKVYMKDQTEMRIFNKSDLYANQNFTQDIDRLRTSSFKGIKKKNVSVKVEDNSKKKQITKTLKKQKKKAKKKKKKKDEKKKTEIAETEIQEEERNKDNDEKNNLEPTNKQAPDYIAQEPLDEQNSFWLNLLISNPSEENFEAFYNAYTNGEIEEAKYFSTHQALYTKLGGASTKFAVALLMRTKHSTSFSLLFDYQDKKTSYLGKDLKDEVQNHLISYNEKLPGLKALKSLLSTDADIEALRLSAKLLKQASERDLNSKPQARNNTPVQRGEESNEESNSDLISFYIGLHSFLLNSDLVADLPELDFELKSLTQFIGQNLDLNSPAFRGSSRT